MATAAPRIAAIIGHADDPAMLDVCVAHHLSVGIANIFVSFNRGQAGLGQRLVGDDRVRALPVEAFSSADSFHYFSHAVREVDGWAAPDWVLFADTDEFWLPRSGDLRRTECLAGSDLVIVDRYNAFPRREADGTLSAPDFRAPFRQLMILAREAVEDAYQAGDYRIPWIFGVDAPKLLVRPAFVRAVGPGGHNIVATDPGLRWAMPEDVVIQHVPFTDEQRFRRKITAVRHVLSTHANRFDIRQAWHWRYWLSLSDEMLGEEFRRQAIPATSLGVLGRDAVVGIADDLYRELGQLAGRLRGDALYEFLERVIINYDRTQTMADAMPRPPGGST